MDWNGLSNRVEEHLEESFALVEVLSTVMAEQVENGNVKSNDLAVHGLISLSLALSELHTALTYLRMQMEDLHNTVSGLTETEGGNNGTGN